MKAFTVLKPSVYPDIIQKTNQQQKQRTQYTINRRNAVLSIPDNILNTVKRSACFYNKIMFIGTVKFITREHCCSHFPTTSKRLCRLSSLVQGRLPKDYTRTRENGVYRNKLTAVHFIKANLNPSAITVFDCIFDQILQAFCKAVGRDHKGGKRGLYEL